MSQNTTNSIIDLKIMITYLKSYVEEGKYQDLVRVIKDIPCEHITSQSLRDAQQEIKDMALFDFAYILDSFLSRHPEKQYRDVAVKIINELLKVGANPFWNNNGVNAFEYITVNKEVKSVKFAKECFKGMDIDISQYMQLSLLFECNHVEATTDTIDEYITLGADFFDTSIEDYTFPIIALAGRRPDLFLYFIQNYYLENYEHILFKNKNLMHFVLAEAPDPKYQLHDFTDARQTLLKLFTSQDKITFFKDYTYESYDSSLLAFANELLGKATL